MPACAKSRKTNNAKSRKWWKTSIWAFFGTISRPNISKLQIFQKNRFHSNWRSHLVLTSGQKPKKLLESFLRKISVFDFGLIWRLFANISKSSLFCFVFWFFLKNLAQWLFYFYSPPPSNRPTNQLLPITSISRTSLTPIQKAVGGNTLKIC